MPVFPVILELTEMYDSEGLFPVEWTFLCFFPKKEKVVAGKKKAKPKKLAAPPIEHLEEEDSGVDSSADSLAIPAKGKIPPIRLPSLQLKPTPVPTASTSQNAVASVKTKRSRDSVPSNPSVPSKRAKVVNVVPVVEISKVSNIKTKKVESPKVLVPATPSLSQETSIIPSTPSQSLSSLPSSTLDSSSELDLVALQRSLEDAQSSVVGLAGRLAEVRAIRSRLAYDCEVYRSLAESRLSIVNQMLEEFQEKLVIMHRPNIVPPEEASAKTPSKTLELAPNAKKESTEEKVVEKVAE